MPRRGLLIGLGAFAVTAACSPGTTSSGGAAPRSEDPVAAPDIGGGALDFQGRTLDGATLDASTLAGTPVVLWFWAPWCVICRAEATDVAALAAEYDNRVRVLGIPGRGEVDAMREFVADTGTGAITHVVDDGSLWNRFGVISQPAFVFVDRSGAAETFAGSPGADHLRAVFDELS